MQGDLQNFIIADTVIVKSASTGTVVNFQNFIDLSANLLSNKEFAEDPQASNILKTIFNPYALSVLICLKKKKKAKMDNKKTKLFPMPERL